MKLASSVVLLAALAAPVAANVYEGTNGIVFVDDLGYAHQRVENPKLVLSAQMAVSLHHLGMPDDMLLAHYGLPFNRASYQNTETGNDPQYATDGQAEDVVWLSKFTSVTPQCWSGQGVAYGTCGSYFDGVDYDIVRTLNPKPDFVAESPRFFSPEVAVNFTKIANVDFIFIDAAFEGGQDCRPDRTQDNAGYLKDNCYRRSSAQILHRYEDLARFLGWDMTPEAAAEKNAMCEASRRLSASAKSAHERGIRVMGGSIFPSQNDGPFMYITNPGQFYSLRAMEGLGVPVLWPGKCPQVRDAALCYEYGPIPEGYEGIPTSQYFTNCQGSVVNEQCAATGGLYDVDFWVMEGTGYTQLLEGKLQSDFPDPAIMKGQYYYLDANEGVISYKSQAAYFNELAKRLDAAENVHTNDGTCVPVDHSHGTKHNNHLDGGLGGGQFACYNTEYHDDYCEAVTTFAGAKGASSAGRAVYAIAGVVGSVVAGVLAHM